MANTVISLHSGEALHQPLHVEFSAATAQSLERSLHHFIVLQEFANLIRVAPAPRAIRCMRELLISDGSSSSWGVIESMMIR